MNYRHAYHAGNLGDVIKHCALVLWIEMLQAQHASLRWIDTHAGCGRYNLLSEMAFATGEAQKGIFHVWPAMQRQSQWQSYVKLLQSMNAPGVLQYYPGSPLIIQKLMRPTDQLLAVEKHPDDFRCLERYLPEQTNILLSDEDGYDELHQWVPKGPSCVVMDPPFEKDHELDDMDQTLFAYLKPKKSAMHGANQPRYAFVWYPLLAREKLPMATVLKGVPRSIIEVKISNPSEGAGLIGTGLMIVGANPAQIQSLQQRLMGLNDLSPLGAPLTLRVLPLT